MFRNGKIVDSSYSSRSITSSSSQTGNIPFGNRELPGPWLGQDGICKRIPRYGIRICLHKSECFVSQNKALQVPTPRYRDKLLQQPAILGSPIHGYGIGDIYRINPPNYGVILHLYEARCLLLFLHSQRCDKPSNESHIANGLYLHQEQLHHFPVYRHL